MGTIYILASNNYVKIETFEPTRGRSIGPLAKIECRSSPVRLENSSRLIRFVVARIRNDRRPPCLVPKDTAILCRLILSWG